MKNEIKYTMTAKEFLKEAFPKAENIYVWIMISPGRARCIPVSRRAASSVIKPNDDFIYARFDEKNNLHVGIPPFWDLIIEQAAD